MITMTSLGVHKLFIWHIAPEIQALNSDCHKANLHIWIHITMLFASTKNNLKILILYIQTENYYNKQKQYNINHGITEYWNSRHQTGSLYCSKYHLNTDLTSSDSIT